ncbi:MAG: hypothetical protein ACKVPX_00210 [Myxococcaceae bacterium]
MEDPRPESLHRDESLSQLVAGTAGDIGRVIQAHSAWVQLEVQTRIADAKSTALRAVVLAIGASAIFPLLCASVVLGLVALGISPWAAALLVTALVTGVVLVIHFTMKFKRKKRI